MNTSSGRKPSLGAKSFHLEANRLAKSVNWSIVQRTGGFFSGLSASSVSSTSSVLTDSSGAVSISAAAESVSGSICSTSASSTGSGFTLAAVLATCQIRGEGGIYIYIYMPQWCLK